jgi:hypothetical protein
MDDQLVDFKPTYLKAADCEPSDGNSPDCEGAECDRPNGLGADATHSRSWGYCATGDRLQTSGLWFAIHRNTLPYEHRALPVTPNVRLQEGLAKLFIRHDLVSVTNCLVERDRGRHYRHASVKKPSQIA